jgi:hypothetical protein
MTNCTGTSRDEYRLPTNRTVSEESAVSRQCGNPQTSSDLEVDMIGERDSLGCWEDNILGSASKGTPELSIPEPDALSHA